MGAPVKTQIHAAPKVAVSSGHGNLLQRQCACGGTPGPSGECEACRQKRETGMLQRASTQPRAAAFSPHPSEAPPIVHDVLRSPGQPLDAATRSFMEPRFGHDFSGVRVHTDARAAESARAVNALAYTVGRDVVFGAGQHQPQSSAGQRLMAHELAHVVQQSGSEQNNLTQLKEKRGLASIVETSNTPATEVIARHGRVLIQRDACEALAPPNCDSGTCEEGKQCVGGDWPVCFCWSNPHEDEGSHYEGGGGQSGGGGSSDSW